MNAKSTSDHGKTEDEMSLADIAREEARLAELRKKAEARVQEQIPAWRKELEQHAFVTYGVSLARIMGLENKKKTNAKREGVSSDKPCPKCHFKTEPPHDGRKHKFVEGFQDKPFTAQKLKELGLTKID